MRRMHLVSLLVILFVAVGTSLAQGRSFVWERWDMVIDNIDTTANQFDVSEIYEIRFNGTYRFGTALILDDRAESLTITGVSINGVALPRSCSAQQNAYCDRRASDGVDLRYYFPQPVTDANVSIRIDYRVLGGLRVYDDYHMLNWYAVSQEHAARVQNSLVVVNVPANAPFRDGIDSIVTPDVPAQIEVCVDFATCPIDIQSYLSAIDGQAIVIRAERSLGIDEPFEFLFTYTPDPNMPKPAWQDAFDQQRAFEETILPLINFLLVVLSVVVGLGGPLFIYAWYYERGRDPQIGPVPEYLTEPPSDLRPAAVGTLIDERADVADILSTIADLGNRGYLVMEEDRNEGFFGIGARSTFTFKRTDKKGDLSRFEERFMRAIFGTRDTQELDKLRNKFYTNIPKLQTDLYSELVNRKYFTKSPEVTRNIYRGWGSFFLFAPGLVLFFLVGEDLGILTSPYAIFLLVALMINGIFLMIMSNFMPAKTYEGATEAARWRAFKNYLQNLQSYTNVDMAAERFAEYLPYAIAFGLEKHWIGTFANLNNPRVFPRWYYPRHVWGRTFSAGSPAPAPGDVNLFGGGGLNAASGNLSSSLNAMSSGLTSMLNSASSALTSSPSSSGSSRGGGGFRGGGGGGGGSRGFG